MHPGYFIILLCLTPAGFTYQWESAEFIYELIQKKQSSIWPISECNVTRVGGGRGLKERALSKSWGWAYLLKALYS
jgi:hypothetical protein